MDHPGGILPRVSVSIVVYNSSLELLRRTLHSLAEAIAAARAAGTAEAEVTLVDNGSAPEYRQQLSALLQEIKADRALHTHFVPLPENVGFGAGHNRALAGHVGDYHLILNPDVEVAADALVLGVRRLRDDPSVALLSPRAMGSDGCREFLCKRQPSVLVLILRAFLPGLGRRLFPTKMARYEMSDVCNSDAEVAVPLASGCFMLVRSDFLRQVGGFDERYFLYFEDFDLSLRLGELGTLLYVPALNIVHHGGYAASKGWRHLQLFASAGLRFFRQHGWRWI